MTGQVLIPALSQQRTPSAFFGRDCGMAFFLAFLVVITVFLPMLTLSRFGRISLSVVFVLMLTSGALATIRHPALRYFVIGLGLTTFTVDMAGEFTVVGLSIWETSLRLACLSLLVLMTLKQTLRPGPVTIYRVMGGIAGYLLIGYTWVYIYQLLVQLMPEAICFQNAAFGTLSRQPNDLVYFSFITLTTVGYGDVHPVHPLVRSMAVAEALLGQLYIAILISTLVGMAIQTKSVRDDVSYPSG